MTALDALMSISSRGERKFGKPAAPSVSRARRSDFVARMIGREGARVNESGLVLGMFTEKTKVRPFCAYQGKQDKVRRDTHSREAYEHSEIN
jgi:hypothetical protein